MKKVLKMVNRLSLVALICAVGNLSAQTGENPKPKTNPTPPRQNHPTPPPPPPPPMNFPRPIMIPGQIYNPPGQIQGNMGVAPQKSQEEIAKENRENAHAQVLKELFQLTADVQEFTITDVTKPFAVTGKNGFKIEFPEFAFADENGNTILGDVKVNLTEYNSFSEFAAAGLTTETTDGAILETSGMLNLSAKSGENKLKLAAGKTIKITIPNTDTKKGFETYYGYGKEKITWSKTPQQNNNFTDSEPFVGYTIKMLKPNGHVNGDNISMAFYKNEQPLEEYVNAKLKVSEDIKRKILKDGIPFVYTIEFNALGKIKSVVAKHRELTDKTLISSMNKQITKILTEAPAFDMTEGGLMSGKPYDIIFATVKNYTSEGVKIAPQLQFPTQIKNEVKVNSNPNQRNVEEYTLQATSLDKINSDRLSGFVSNDTATFHFEQADAMIYVIVKDMRAIITPQANHVLGGSYGDYFMTKIPAGTAVKYVAVVYDDQGNVHISTLNTTFAKGKVEFHDRIPFSAMNLKTALDEN
jgi:hypothetical protein